MTLETIVSRSLDPSYDLYGRLTKSVGNYLRIGNMIGVLEESSIERSNSWSLIFVATSHALRNIY